MTNPLDGNGVEALKPCPFCGAAFLIAQEPHDNHPVAGMFYIYHDYGPISSAARACIIDVRRHFASREEAITAWNLRTPTPSQTAVEPVARFNPVLDTEDGGYGFVTMKQSEHGQWVPLSTLTAQAAALVAAEKERDEAREQELWWKKCGDWEGDMHDFYRSRSTRLEAALLKVSAQLGVHAALSDTEKLAEIERLTGLTLGPVKLKERTDTRPETAPAETAESEVATLKARIAELEARFNSQMDYGVHLQRIIEAICNDRPIRDDAKEGAPHHAAMATAYRARRLTHQEKNNAG